MLNIYYYKFITKRSTKYAIHSTYMLYTKGVSVHIYTYTLYIHTLYDTLSLLLNSLYALVEEFSNVN